RAAGTFDHLSPHSIADDGEQRDRRRRGGARSSSGRDSSGSASARHLGRRGDPPPEARADDGGYSRDHAERRCDAEADRQASRAGGCRLPDEADRRAAITERPRRAPGGKARGVLIAGEREPCLLIVDDQSANVRLLEQLLARAGYKHYFST